MKKREKRPTVKIGNERDHYHWSHSDNKGILWILWPKVWNSIRNGSMSFEGHKLPILLMEK